MSCDKVCPCPRGIDYYGVLSLKKNSDDLEIKAAFRRLAIRYNPIRAKDESLWTIFSLVAEAYDVLSNPFKRAIYDQFGEEGLKNGVPGDEGFIQPYIYHGEPMRTYREFFGTESPYADLFHVLTQPSSVLEFPEGRGLKRKEEPLIKTLYLTLLEVPYRRFTLFIVSLSPVLITVDNIGDRYGKPCAYLFLLEYRPIKLISPVPIFSDSDCLRFSIRFSFDTRDDKSKTVTKEKILTIPIKPGIPTGTRIIFPEEGDQGPTKIPGKLLHHFQARKHVSVADVIFITEDRPHETFRREGSDLHMTVDIFLREALTGTVVTVNTLDDRTLRIPITSVIAYVSLSHYRPNYRKYILKEGLPLPENPKDKGNLIITFNIEFPVYLPVSNKTYIKKAFDTSEDIRNTEYIHRLILANKMRRNMDFDVPVRRDPDDEEAKQLDSECNS
ncbi:dnaJ homolog subfamily B member 13-like [Osmia bicornis bicornis]|uniref:dnaJ homolog subfamily B member 13-like n=1 Tax=Osmia bicornis bicornis TaxID=1437191 RepID=UPI001EAE89D6|nr:dnaJ homolog subfamily B member 13-like [Osmia bicornis bicornis]